MVMPSAARSNWPSDNGLDHRIPVEGLVLGHAVESAADVIDGGVVPAAGLAGCGVDVVERQVGVLDGDGDLAAVEVDEELAVAGRAGFDWIIGATCGSNKSKRQKQREDAGEVLHCRNPLPSVMTAAAQLIEFDVETVTAQFS